MEGREVWIPNSEERESVDSNAHTHNEGEVGLQLDIVPGAVMFGQLQNHYVGIEEMGTFWKLVTEINSHITREPDGDSKNAKEVPREEDQSTAENRSKYESSNQDLIFILID